MRQRASAGTFSSGVAPAAVSPLANSLQDCAVAFVGAGSEPGATSSQHHNTP